MRRRSYWQIARQRLPGEKALSRTSYSTRRSGVDLPCVDPCCLAGDAQGGVAVRERSLRLRPQEGDHALGAEGAPVQVGLLGTQDLQLAGRQVWPGVDAVVPQVVRDHVGGVGVRDVDDLLVTLQALAQEGREDGAVLIFGLVDAAQVIARRQVADDAYIARHVRGVADSLPCHAGPRVVPGVAQGVGTPPRV